MECRRVLFRSRIRAHAEYLVVVPASPGRVLLLDARHDGGHVESIIFVNGDPPMENQHLALPMRNEPDRGRPHRYFIQRFSVAAPVDAAPGLQWRQSSRPAVLLGMLGTGFEWLVPGQCSSEERWEGKGGER